MARKLCGRTVSDMGLGTWGMGGRQSPDPAHDKEHVQAIKYALEKGINVIDTAEMYAAGHTEEVVGKAIEDSDREKLFIISKVWHTHLHHDSLINSAEQSLKRLNTDYIDLYLVHWPNSAVPIKETISAMEELKSRGMVRNIGVSNFNIPQMQEAMEAAEESRICANQIEYNLSTRRAEEDIIPFCEKNGIDIIAYTPIMKGHTTDFPLLKKMAGKYRATEVQIALRYTMQRAIPIPKTSSREHLDELLKASRIELSSEDYELLRS